MSTLPTDENSIVRRTKCSLTWIVVSFSISTIILIWVLSLPFRSAHGTILTSGSVTDDEAGLAPATRPISREAEAVRQRAIDADREFMKSLREKRLTYEMRPAPGVEEMRREWIRHVTWVQGQVRQLDDAPQGSLARQYRQELIRSTQDDLPPAERGPSKSAVD